MAANKTVGTQLIELQSVTANTVVISDELNVEQIFYALVGIHLGRRATTALSAATIFRVEGSVQASGAGYWFTLQEFISALFADTAETEAVDGTVNSGTNVITVASTTNLLKGNIIYIDNTLITNSEWGRIKLVTTDTSVTIEDALNNAQTGSTIFNKGEFFSAIVDVRAIKRLRLVVDASASGQAIAVDAYINLFRET